MPIDELREPTPPRYGELNNEVHDTVSVSEFKATCLSVLERVRGTGRPLLVTKRGAPLALVLPPPHPKSTAGDAFGCMAGTSREEEDILEPLPEEDWEALK